MPDRGPAPDSAQVSILTEPHFSHLKNTPCAGLPRGLDAIMEAKLSAQFWLSEGELCEVLCSFHRGYPELWVVFSISAGVGARVRTEK